ncbi:hypothetical protein P879_02220 [Paragonimus westermani]|uniref:Uncharacterized protein n=1 Tax=Paragonimus westermani TaxID=34504 RepID=A0A8T0DTI3_9TREM|nr:hypothetical protein P879_02220 [Paragonimus westermani]
MVVDGNAATRRVTDCPYEIQSSQESLHTQPTFVRAQSEPVVEMWSEQETECTAKVSASPCDYGTINNREEIDNQSMSSRSPVSDHSSANSVARQNDTCNKGCIGDISGNDASGLSCPEDHKSRAVNSHQVLQHNCSGPIVSCSFLCEPNYVPLTGKLDKESTQHLVGLHLGESPFDITENIYIPSRPAPVQTSNLPIPIRSPYATKQHCSVGSLASYVASSSVDDVFADELKEVSNTGPQQTHASVTLADYLENLNSHTPYTEPTIGGPQPFKPLPQLVNLRRITGLPKQMPKAYSPTTTNSLDELALTLKHSTSSESTGDSDANSPKANLCSVEYLVKRRAFLQTRLVERYMELISLMNEEMELTGRPPEDYNQCLHDYHAAQAAIKHLRSTDRPDQSNGSNSEQPTPPISVRDFNGVGQQESAIRSSTPGLPSPNGLLGSRLQETGFPLAAHTVRNASIKLSPSASSLLVTSRLSLQEEDQCKQKDNRSVPSRSPGNQIQVSRFFRHPSNYFRMSLWVNITSSISNSTVSIFPPLSYNLPPVPSERFSRLEQRCPQAHLKNATIAMYDISQTASRSLSSTTHPKSTTNLQKCGSLRTKFSK